MPPMTLELSKDKTFTIDLPFETEVLNFTTDNDRIAKKVFPWALFILFFLLTLFSNV